MINNKFLNQQDYIELLKDKKTILVKDYKSSINGIINRHDVDFSLNIAYELSRFELENNIKATYYILLTSDMYNPFSYDSITKIKMMINDGFEIGLHFDPTVYGDMSNIELLTKMNIEIDMFEKVFEVEIKSYSMHNPSLSGKFLENNKLINAYNSTIFNNDRYISDSSFSFRGKNPSDFLEQSKNNLIQFLTHPEHLFSNGKISYENPVNIILNNYYNKLDLIWSVNEVYRKQKDNYKIFLSNN